MLQTARHFVCLAAWGEASNMNRFVLCGVLASAFTLAGCASSIGPAAMMGLLTLGLLLVGCSEKRTCGDGRSGDIDGTCDTCCFEGRLTTCYCPPNVACNYGLGGFDCIPDAGTDAGVDSGASSTADTAFSDPGGP